MATAISTYPLTASPRTATVARLATCLIWFNVVALAAVSLWFRGWQLATIPGINGDEAWYGIEAMHWLAGQPVQWRTPTGNPMNLLYFGPLLLLHMFVEPSVAALRIPALVSGLAALPVGYWLARKTFGAGYATAATLMLAVLPVNIAYSRFGWDASQTLLATLPVVFLPLWAMSAQAHRQRLLLAAAVCLVAAMWVHPTNVFAAPMIVLPALWMWQDELRVAWTGQPAWRRRWAVGAAIGIVVAMAVLAQHWTAPILKRLADPVQFGTFLIHYFRLFSGVTVYRFIAGSGQATDPWTSLARYDLLPSDVVTWAVAGAALVVVWQRARQDLRGRDACLLASWATMLLGFYLVAGTQAVRPHYERYAICLVAPAVALLARAIELGCRQSGRADSPARTAGLALAWLLVLGFGTHYFAFFYRTGGQSHDTFRAGFVEPKQAALAKVLAAAPADEVTWIVAGEYWNERPLAYLASPHGHLRVVSQMPMARTGRFLAALENRRIWLIEFAGTAEHRTAIEQLAAAGFDYEEELITDFAGRPVLAVLRPVAGAGIGDRGSGIRD